MKLRSQALSLGVAGALTAVSVGAMGLVASARLGDAIFTASSETRYGPANNLLFTLNKDH